MLESIKELAGVGIPDFPANGLVELSQRQVIVGAYAVKSAEAVAALEASGLNLACQTAPLCPMKVPILGEKSAVSSERGRTYIPVTGNSVAKHWVSI